MPWDLPYWEGGVSGEGLSVNIALGDVHMILDVERNCKYIV
jgi:hypothetical protein